MTVDPRRERLQQIREAIASDALAITFQTMGQYRTHLLLCIDEMLISATASVCLCGHDADSHHCVERIGKLGAANFCTCNSYRAGSGGESLRATERGTADERYPATVPPIPPNASYHYPHMCRDGHAQIGHSDSGDDERCPVCRMRDEIANSAEHQRCEIAALQSQLQSATSRLTNQ